MEDIILIFMVIAILIVMLYFSNKYPGYFMIFTFLVIVFISIAGCQAVKDVGGNVASPFQSTEKRFVQRTINEWTALARVEIRWNEVPQALAHQRNLDNLETVCAPDVFPFQTYCFPRAVSYPRSRDTIKQGS